MKRNKFSFVAGICWLALCAFCVSSCATIEYKGNSDGSTEVKVTTLFADDIIKDFHARVAPGGSRSLDVGELSRNETNGLKAFADIMQKISEGLSKGAVEGVTK